MKKLGIYLMSFLALGFASCNDFDFEEATPQANPQEPLLSFDGLTLAPAATSFDLNSSSADAQVQLLSISAQPTLSDGQELAFTAQFGADETFKKSVSVELDGAFTTVETLNNVYRTLKGKTPKAGDVYVRYMAFVAEGTSKVRFGEADTYFAQGTVNLTPIPMEFVVEEKYYLIGGMNDWNAGNLLEFSHSDADVYDDPVFNAVFDCGSDCYWKIVPQSTVDAVAAGTIENIWAGEIWGVAVDGDDATEGELINANAQAAKIPAAGKYRITINMMDNTYKVEAAGDPYVYLVGNPNGWNPAESDITLYSPKFNNVFTGTVTLGADSYFRFFKSLGDWDQPQVGAAEADGTNVDVVLTDGVFTSPAYNGKGCWVAREAGTYKMTLDLNAMTFTMEAVEEDPSQYTYLYIVGNLNGWEQNATAEGAKNGEMVCKDGSNVYSGTFEFPAADETGLSYFRFYTALGDWNTGSIGAADAEDNVLLEFEDGMSMGGLQEGSQFNYIIPAGKYSVSVDLNEKILVLTALN